jgi:hypothetical protein
MGKPWFLLSLFLTFVLTDALSQKQDHSFETPIKLTTLQAENDDGGVIVYWRFIEGLGLKLVKIKLVSTSRFDYLLKFTVKGFQNSQFVKSWPVSTTLRAGKTVGSYEIGDLSADTWVNSISLTDIEVYIGNKITGPPLKFVTIQTVNTNGICGKNVTNFSYLCGDIQDTVIANLENRMKSLPENKGVKQMEFDHFTIQNRYVGVLKCVTRCSQDNTLYSHYKVMAVDDAEIIRLMAPLAKDKESAPGECEYFVYDLIDTKKNDQDWLHSIYGNIRTMMLDLMLGKDTVIFRKVKYVSIGVRG